VKRGLFARQLRLDRRDRMDRVCARELVDSDLRQADRARLARADRAGERGPRLLERQLGVDAVQLVEVDVIDAEASERAVDPLALRAGGSRRL
jgi:hypothetical protein